MRVSGSEIEAHTFQLNRLIFHFFPFD